MSNLRPTTIAAYTLGKVRWQCFVRGDRTYVWRSECGRLTAWREGSAWFCARDGRPGGRAHKDVVSAMLSAQGEQRRARA